MTIRLHPHALARMAERGASESEVQATLTHGKREPAKLGRWKFTHFFAGPFTHREIEYAGKLVEAIAVEQGDWLVLTVIVKFTRAAGN